MGRIGSGRVSAGRMQIAIPGCRCDIVVWCRCERIRSGTSRCGCLPHRLIDFKMVMMGLMAVEIWRGGGAMWWWWWCGDRRQAGIKVRKIEKRRWWVSRDGAMWWCEVVALMWWWCGARRVSRQHQVSKGGRQANREATRQATLCLVKVKNFCE